MILMMNPSPIKILILNTANGAQIVSLYETPTVTSAQKIVSLVDPINSKIHLAVNNNRGYLQVINLELLNFQN